MTIKEKLARSFEGQMKTYWANLDRTTNLMIILNFSLFFISELVISHGYFYTYFSLACFGLVKLGLLLPLGLLNRLWYYLIFLVLECVGIYFLVSSVWFWVVSNLD